MIIYDAEIIKPVKMKDTIPEEGIEYCDSWTDFKNMGISVVCAYSYDYDQYHVYLEDNLDSFISLVDSDPFVVGFNSQMFDDRLLLSHGHHVSTSYDILREIYRALGLNPFPESPGPEYRGYGLDAVSSAMGLKGKNGNGAMAPVQWQRGFYGSVIDYCLTDVWLTKEIMDKVLSHIPIINPKDSSDLLLRLPYEPYKIK